jgi:cob(I)alamin adenosyltransferase
MTAEPAPALDEDARHAERMRRRKAARDAMMAGKTIEKGLFVVHTGPGKGKTTAALGMVMRCVGHGMPVGIVQFIKGRLGTGETAVLERFPDLVTVRRMGEGFTWETQDRARDVAAAGAAWAEGRAMIASGAYAMVLLDEINIALRYDYLTLADVLAGIAARPEGVHVVATGRNAKDEMIAAADLVTEMTAVKHPFRSGVKPQAGIEY